MSKVSLRGYNREIEEMIENRQLAEAIAHCQYIMGIYPKYIEIYRSLGRAYLEDKRYNVAEDIFARVLVAVPSDRVALVGMSIISDENDKIEDAIRYMERVFDIQASNPSIQRELQRLYGRRDGVTPPRIRITRSALAHMYIRGKLYPQGISEIKQVLKDDPERNDMQSLLAFAYYKAGLHNEAVKVATDLLHKFPYSLDANRVLVEVFKKRQPGNVDLYRQRVIELDPYAAYAPDSIFLSSDILDPRIMVERLNFTAQPFASSKSSVNDSEIPSFLRAPEWEKTEDDDDNDVEIPEFLRAAGWGKSTKLNWEEVTINPKEDITQNSEHEDNLPDWVKAMAHPAKDSGQDFDEKDDVPDWIRDLEFSQMIGQNTDNKWDTKLAKTEKYLSVFLCHSSGDKPIVRKLYEQLSNENWIDPWLDEEKLDPGDRWNFEIRKAVKNADIVIVCISNSSINKEGFIQKEIKFALDVADEKPDGTIFIIPLKLEECTVPDRLSEWQWVNYYEQGAYKRLMRSLQKRAKDLGIRGW